MGELDIQLIVAVANNGGIGREGKLPWQGRLRRDMNRFRALTIYKPVIMGRKTYESIPDEYRPLRDRINIVLTQQEKEFSGAIIAHSIEEALDIAGEYKRPIMIAGGGEVYQATIEQASTIHVTRITRTESGKPYNPPNDTYFPRISPYLFEMVDSEKFTPDQRNPFYYQFETWRRK